MNKKILTLSAISLALAISTTASADATRDTISIVGSSTVYPFSTVVAEKFGKIGKFKTPKVESTGTGGGFKLFCGGIGAQNPDITNASRAIKDSEIQACKKAGVNEIVEIKIGFDGIVFMHSKKNTNKFELTRKEIFMALAKKVPNPNGEEALIDNPYKNWKQINAKLPDTKIEVIGPPPSSGTRDALAELALEGGCQEFPWIKALKSSDEKEFKKVCMTIREDGAYIEAGENDNLIIQKLENNPAAIGISGYSYMDQNLGKISAAPVDGVAPSYETISSGKYPISRPLFFYVKKAHIGTIPGIVEFIAEFTSEKAWGDEGYLAEKGLIPLPKAEREEMAIKSKFLKSVD